MRLLGFGDHPSSKIKLLNKTVSLFQKKRHYCKSLLRLEFEISVCRFSTFGSFIRLQII